VLISSTSASLLNIGYLNTTNRLRVRTTDLLIHTLYQVVDLAL